MVIIRMVTPKLRKWHRHVLRGFSQKMSLLIAAHIEDIKELLAWLSPILSTFRYGNLKNYKITTWYGVENGLEMLNILDLKDFRRFNLFEFYSSDEKILCHCLGFF